MEKILNNIIDYLLQEIAKMPSFYRILTLILLALFFLYLSSADFRKFLQVKILAKLKFSTNFIETNELFISERYFCAQINNINFQNKAKERLFKIILKEKIKTTIEFSKVFLNQNKEKFKSWTPQIFYQEIYSLIFTIVEGYESKILNKFISIYGKERGTDIYNLTYLSGFKIYHNENIEFVLIQIRKILFSKLKDEKIKIYFVFTEFYIALETAIADCELIFETFNGNLHKLLNN